MRRRAELTQELPLQEYRAKMRLTVSVLFAILGFGIGLLRESSHHRLFASLADKHAQLASTTGALALPPFCCRPSAHMHAQGTHWRLRGRHARRPGRLPLDSPHAQAPHRHLGVPRHRRRTAHRLLCVCRAPAAQPLLTSLRASQSSASASRPTRKIRARHAHGAATSPVCPPCASAPCMASAVHLSLTDLRHTQLAVQGQRPHHLQRHVVECRTRAAARALSGPFHSWSPAAVLSLPLLLTYSPPTLTWTVSYLPLRRTGLIVLLSPALKPHASRSGVVNVPRRWSGTRGRRCKAVPSDTARANERSLRLAPSQCASPRRANESMVLRQRSLSTPRASVTVLVLLSRVMHCASGTTSQLESALEA